MKKPPKAARRASRPSPSKRKTLQKAAPVVKALKPELKPTPEELNQQEQTQLYDKAMGLFHRRDFTRAREVFARVASGPATEKAHAAQMHLRMCDRRLGREQVEPRTPEDHYNYGISLMNSGQHERAEGHLRKAVAGNDRADHFHYALALCAGLRGDYEASARHLRRAIELQPANRGVARNDTDFQAIASHPGLREILHPERSHSG